MLIAVAEFVTMLGRDPFEQPKLSAEGPAKKRFIRLPIAVALFVGLVSFGVLLQEYREFQDLAEVFVTTSRENKDVMKRDDTKNGTEAVQFSIVATDENMSSQQPPHADEIQQPTTRSNGTHVTTTSPPAAVEMVIDESVWQEATKVWQNTAPSISTDIPEFMRRYVLFHRQSLANIDPANDTNHYLIYSCAKYAKCSGTGNRQRAIFMLFVIAMVTDRVLLIEEENLIPLEDILQPNLINWTTIPAHLDQLPSIFYDRKKIESEKNANPWSNVSMPPINQLKEWPRKSLPQVIRVLTNGPGSLKTVFKDDLFVKYVGDVDDKWFKPKVVPVMLYRWIFSTLFRPSPALTKTVAEMRNAMNLTSFSHSPYMGVHVRAGGDFVGTNEIRYNTSNMGPVLNASVTLRDRSDLPIVVISDTNAAKKAVSYYYSSRRVTYVETMAYHVDKSNSKKDVDHLSASLGVWADVLVLAQSECIVVSSGSFGALAERISKSKGRCTDVLIPNVKADLYSRGIESSFTPTDNSAFA